MRERPFCQMAAGAILGILLARASMGWLFFPAAAVLWTGFLVYRKRRQSVLKTAGGFWVVLYGTAAFLASVGGYARECSLQQMRSACELYVKEGETLYLQGKLIRKQEKNQQYIYELSGCRIWQCLSANGVMKEDSFADKSNRMVLSCGNVQVSMESDAYSIGEILVLKGDASLWETARNEGNFDAESFYHAKGLEFQIRNPQIVNTCGTPDRWRETLYQWKKQIKNVYQTLLPERVSGILITMILGDNSLLDGEVKEAYQLVGISHILAISGLHVSILGMMGYRLLRRVGFGFWGAGIPVAVILWSYGEMVGFGSSVFRAVCMFLLLITAQAVGRSYDSLNAMGFAALCLLLKNPGILFYAGFQLSFGAVLGVVLFGRILREHTPGHPWIEKVLTGAAIQAATLPLVSWYYYEIPVYAAAVNLLVLPFMGVVLLLGIAGGLTGLRFPALAKYIFLPCQVILSIYEKISDITKQLPNPVWITGCPPAWKMILYYTLLSVMVLWCAHYRKKGETPLFSLRKLAAGTAVVGGLMLFLFFPAKGGLELDVLDVGQGDGIFLRTESGYQLFFDGGSTDVSQVGAYRIEPFLKYRGVRKIDYWIVSHTDYDHISGLEELLEEGYPIENLLFAKEIPKDEAYGRLEQLAVKNGTKIRFMEQGQILHLGTAKLKALSPGQEAWEDKNALSLVLLYEEMGFSGIFTGDIGAEQERQILEAEELAEVDFYKAAHHGSKYSNSEEFLCRLKPAVSVVSCGENNRYGHPGEEAVSHMKEVGSRIFYTMEGGQIKIWRKKETLFMETYRTDCSITLEER